MEITLPDQLYQVYQGDH